MLLGITLLLVISNNPVYCQQRGHQNSLIRQRTLVLLLTFPITAERGLAHLKERAASVPWGCETAAPVQDLDENCPLKSMAKHLTTTAKLFSQGNALGILTWDTPDSALLGAIINPV